MDSKETLHIRCGSDIKNSLAEAGFVGEFLEFSDPFCQGPLKAVTEDEFIQIRAKFLAESFHGQLDETHEKVTSQYAKLKSLTSYDEIQLWFEHDSYDQLILAYLLSVFSTLDDLPPVYLICIDDFPVEPRFIGLGQLSPDNLKSLWGGRVRVTTEYFMQSAKVWLTLVQGTPEALYSLVNSETFLVPQMKGALKRHLQQLPSLDRGLSLTEELSLNILKGGERAGGKIFRQLMLEDEPLPYLGDMMFACELEVLVAGGAVVARASASANDEPWHKQMYSLTELGADILAGEKDWVQHMRKSRWVGGIEIKPNEKVWRRQNSLAGIEFR